MENDPPRRNNDREGEGEEMRGEGNARPHTSTSLNF